MRKRERLTGYLLITPAFLAIFAVLVYPLGRAIDMSFHKIILTQPNLGQPFIGLENYIQVIKDPIFLNAIENTFVWLFFNLVFQMLFGTLIALLLNESFRGRGLVRGLMLIPWVTPSVVAMLTWRWMYDAEFGIINQFLKSIGVIDKGIAWLGNVDTAMPAVILESVWKGTPFVMLMILAALQAVPRELYDVAKVDGANAVQSFFNVTMPLIMPTFIIAATLTVIYTFNNFNAIWLMTEGGPLRATETLPILVYTLGFRNFDLGRSSAVGVLTLLILLVFVALFGQRYIRSQVDL
ncbi:MAG: sugar ABC transporter permease [Anaerolineae bacterium]|nr:sugar ABC transporter permease [Anaerolineae bacterium]